MAIIESMNCALGRICNVIKRTDNNPMILLCLLKFNGFFATAVSGSRVQKD